VALDGLGSHPAARLTRGHDADPLSARYWVGLVDEAQRAGADFVTIADSYKLAPASAANGTRPSDPARGRLDAIMIACRVAPATRAVGIVPMGSATITEPYLLASQIATLDFASGGRAGWELTIDDWTGAGGYVGPRRIPDHDELAAEAAEYLEVVRRLWDSWEDDAEIRDSVAHRFFDRERVHHIDFEGAYINVKGPSITPRSPQGQPIVAIRVTGEATGAIAVGGADVAFVAAADERALSDRLAALTSAAEAAGRAPRSLRRFAEVGVVLDETTNLAAERRARLDQRAHGLPKADTAARLEYTGTAAGLADQLGAWARLGVDGFRLHPAELPHDLRGLADGLGPLRRAPSPLSPGAPAAGTLRARLGFERPSNRYATP
jgi:alkanesulfonate monooxygenase SsuD/methylene tetrahydromethanopterin reductase-like flavin-dependent oxidoreductase (luciferase family)